MSGYSGLLGCLIGTFLIIFVVVARFLFKVYRLFHQVKKNAEQQFGKQNGYTNDAKGNFYQGQTTNNSKSETIVDNRDTDNAQKKIFSDEEGEYVDFEEDK